MDNCHGVALQIYDFSLLQLIGKGAFGSVYLTSRNTDNRLYAIKVMSKEQIMKTKNWRRVQRERAVMTQANRYRSLLLSFSPCFLNYSYVVNLSTSPSLYHDSRYPDQFVQLFCSFQNQDYLFMVMEYLPVRPSLLTLNIFPTVTD